MRIYTECQSLSEILEKTVDTNEVVLQIATKIGANITTQDANISHRIGRRGQGNKHRPIIAKFVCRDCKSKIMWPVQNKTRQTSEYQGV